MPPKQFHPPSGASLDSLPDSLLSRIIVQSACVFVDRPNGVPQVTWEPAVRWRHHCRRPHRSPPPLPLEQPPCMPRHEMEQRPQGSHAPR